MADDADELHLFYEFHQAMDKLSRRYGVINVADQCRAWADLIDRAKAGFDVRLNDGGGS